MTAETVRKALTMKPATARKRKKTDSALSRPQTIPISSAQVEAIAELANHWACEVAGLARSVDYAVTELRPVGTGAELQSAQHLALAAMDAALIMRERAMTLCIQINRAWEVRK